MVIIAALCRTLSGTSRYITYKSVTFCEESRLWLLLLHYHAGHTRKASRISKAAVDNCGKGVGNFYLS